MDKETIKSRLLSAVNKTSEGCWEWTKALRSGYGALKVDKKVLSTHRLSYEVFVGHIPNDLFVCHKCDNRKCINPTHLFIGTHSENMIDCFKKGRRPNVPGPRFEKGNTPVNSLLTKRDRLAVRVLINNKGNKTLIELSKELSLPYQLLRDISKPRLSKVLDEYKKSTMNG